jgi:hypothetical protein
VHVHGDGKKGQKQIRSGGQAPNGYRLTLHQMGSRLSASEKFKVPQILSYAGDGDPLDHLENFRAHLDLHGTPVEVACRAFPLTLSRNARDWFKKLAPNSVDQFKELSKIFLTEFLAFRTKNKPSGYLLSLHQQSNES